MKKILILTAVCTALLTSCGNGIGTNTANSNSERDSLQRIIDQKDNEINDMMGQFNEIQEGFSLINQAEGRVNMMAQNAENNQTAENIRENMAFIQETMAANRQKIADLEQKLKNSSINASKLKDVINNLSQQLEAKNQELEQLRAQLAEKDVQIATLNENVTNLTAENTEVKQQRDESQQLAQSQDAQLNTAWYVYGTSKELKEHNILKKGDVLKGDYDKAYFTKIDIRKTQVIPFSSKSAKILTTHPADSYSLMKDTKGEYTLRITDAQSFWSISKYLVVQVK